MNEHRKEEAKPSKFVLIDENIVMLVGEINESKVENTILSLMAISFTRPKEDITLIVESWGGEVPPAFHLIDVMRMLPNKITTIGLGKVSSAGLLIFMSGDERKISMNCSVLSHQFSWGNHGKLHELKGRRVQEDIIEERIIQHYVKCTGKTEKYIKKNLLCATDAWLTASQAIKHCLADKVINTLRLEKKRL